MNISVPIQISCEYFVFLIQLSTYRTIIQLGTCIYEGDKKIGQHETLL